MICIYDGCIYMNTEYVYTYIYIYIHMHIYIYTYIHMVTCFMIRVLLAYFTETFPTSEAKTNIQNREAGRNVDFPKVFVFF